MRLALAIVSLAFIFVTLAAATFDTEAGSSAEPRFADSSAQRVWVSAQFGQDGTGWGADAVSQARLALRNLDAELRKSGGSIADVVEITTYHRELSGLGEFRAVLAEVFGDDIPTWTSVEVTDLVEPEALVEIKATAVLGSGR
ncbi:MAG: Rid family hydrolase [Candidatus Eisenbacteria bacterium]